MKTRLYILAALVIAGWALFLHDERTASGLANPNTSGKNMVVRVNGTATQVASGGTNCAITIQVDLDTHDGGPCFPGGCPTRPICSGFANDPGDGGPPGNRGVGLTRSNCSLPVCTDTSKCINTWVTRDTAPGALYLLTTAPLDGGVPARLELSAGCKTP